ncbi:cytochrome P450 [Streptomyces coeruleorubidus]|uniref:cytochrome P450 n=1 Tax=Streptomyces TaxID=1883 RepID=UPI00237F45BB|nr:cytochrome P450 [Streptomyces coeruleorubidus]WDV51808.1 cytochrome P450 [Streptomyces coeruleorubidus]
MTESQTLAEPLDVMIRLLSPEGKQNPYPLYEELRAHGGLVRLGETHLLAVGHEQCARALRHPGLLQTDAAMQDLRMPGWREHSSWVWLTKNMLFSNEPDHERMRRFFSSAFSAHSVAAFAPMVERLADEAVRHLERLTADGGSVDLVEEFTYRFPIAVLGELLSLPQEDLPGLHPVIAAITTSMDPVSDLGRLQPADAAMDRLAEYVTELVALRRAEPGPDLTSAFIRARDAGSDLTEEDLIANLMAVIVAGSEAPQDLLGNAVRIAVENPEYAERIRREPEFVSRFLEEVLRFDPPVHALNRVAGQDLEFFGEKITRGSAVTLLIAAGNRDPERFAEPDRFDPDREGNKQLTFSAGAHYCLGAALARLSAETVLPRLLRRFPKLAIVGLPGFRDQIVQRGHDRLPATLG